MGQEFWRALLALRVAQPKKTDVLYVFYMPKNMTATRTLRAIRGKIIEVSYMLNNQRVKSCGEKSDVK